MNKSNLSFKIGFVLLAIWLVTLVGCVSYEEREHSHHSRGQSSSIGVDVHESSDYHGHH